MPLSIGLNYNSQGLASQRIGPLDAKGNILPATIWDDSLSYARNSANTEVHLTENAMGIFPGVEISGSSSSARIGIDHDINWVSGTTYRADILYKLGTSGMIRGMIYQGTPRHNIAGIIDDLDVWEGFYDGGNELLVELISNAEVDVASGAKLLSYTFVPSANFTAPFQAGPNDGIGNVIIFGATVKIV